jgi:hypothetical protein
MEEHAQSGINPSAEGRAAAGRSDADRGTGKSSYAARSQASSTPPPATQSGGGLGHHDHDHDCVHICGSRPLPEADPVLELRHKRLEQALHGPLGQRRRREYNWNGENQVTVTFDSLEDLLDKAFPPPRPLTDIPDQTFETKQTGS